jgi:aquaporin Z
MRHALARHWPEYLIELIGLAWVMFVALAVASLLWAAQSPVAHFIKYEPLRRALMGLGMASAVMLFAYSRLGKRSGAHLNPAVTFAFYLLGKIEPFDVPFYIVAQTVGGLVGVSLFVAAGRGAAADPRVQYIVTRPGRWGSGAALALETAITFAMMLLILVVSNSRWRRYTVAFAGALLTLLIFAESPLSGTSLNPARSFASAAVAHQWRALWIYLVAPPAGAVMAALFYARLLGRPVYCAKLCHPEHDYRCIFRCGYRQSKGASDDHTV